MKSLQAYTTLLEKIFLVGLVISGVFFLLELEPFDVTVAAVCSFGLALSFFLSAYKSNELPDSDDQLSGAKDVLSLVVLPKLLWISSSVSMVGIALLVLGSDSRGYQRIFFIAGVTIAIATLAAVIAVFAVKQSAKVLWPILLRAIPVLVADLYFLLG